MKSLKTKCSVFLFCASLMLPGAVSAATETGTETEIPPLYPSSATVTNVNGIDVPGKYIFNEDSRVAWIPYGIGIVVVNKDVPLPAGSWYLN